MRRGPRRDSGQAPLSVAVALGVLTLVAVSVWTYLATRPSRPDGKTELVVWNLGFLGPDVALALRDFEKENPEYRVVHSASVAPNTTADGQRLLTAIAGGVPPDMMLFDRFAIGEWAARNALTDLRPLLDAQSSADPNRISLGDFYPWTVDEDSYRRPGSTALPGIYGIPVTVDLRLLFCNSDHLRQAGMVDSATGEPRPPRTWEELRKAATALTLRNANHDIVRLGFAPLFGNSWLYLYAWEAGGSFLSSDGTRVTFDTPEVHRALRFMTDIYDDLGGAARVNAFQSSFQSGVLDPFVQGLVSMKIDSTWSMTLMIDANRDLDFTTSPAPIPEDRLAAGEKPVTWAGGFSFVIPSTSRNKDAAFKLMQFLMSHKTYRFLQQAAREASAAEGRLYLPEPHPNRRYFEEIERAWVQEDPKVPFRVKQAYTVIKAMLPNARIRPPTPIGQVLWNQHVRAMDAAINHVYAGEFGQSDAGKDAEIRHALATMQRDAQAQLDEFLSPPPPHVVRWTPYFLGYAILLALTAAAMYRAYRRHRHLEGYHRREVVAALFFASPWLLGMITLTGGPILFSIVMSFTRYDVLSPARYIGLGNYRDVFFDEMFYKSLANTAFMLLRLPLVMAAGLGIAMLLNRPLRTIGVYRTAFFIPSIVPAVAASLLWIVLLNPNFGLINTALSWVFSLLHINVSPPSWLQDRNWSKPSLILMSLWTAGGGMIIWLAGLQSIPRQLYEAAEIDGANAWQRFRNVTVPMLSPYILFNTIVGVIATLQIFSEAYIMTSGGPADSTLFYAYYLFRNAFQYFRMGYASALAWILFLIVLALTLLQLWASKRWVHYERT